MPGACDGMSRRIRQRLALGRCRSVLTRITRTALDHPHEVIPIPNRIGTGGVTGLGVRFGMTLDVIAIDGDLKGVAQPSHQRGRSAVLSFCREQSRVLGSECARLTRAVLDPYAVGVGAVRVPGDVVV